MRGFWSPKCALLVLRPLCDLETQHHLQGIVYDHSHLMHGVHFFGEQCQLAAWCALTCPSIFWGKFGKVVFFFSSK